MESFRVAIVGGVLAEAEGVRCTSAAQVKRRLVVATELNGHEQGLGTITADTRNSTGQEIVAAVKPDTRFVAGYVGRSRGVAGSGVMIAAALVLPSTHRVAIRRDRLSHTCVLKKCIGIGCVKPKFPLWERRSRGG